VRPTSPEIDPDLERAAFMLLTRALALSAARQRMLRGMIDDGVFTPHSRSRWTERERQANLEKWFSAYDAEVAATDVAVVEVFRR